MMKRLAILALALALPVAAQAQSVATGTVKKVDAKSGKVTVNHGELKDLGMPAMNNMVFRADPAIAGKLKAGQAIEFTVARVGGKLTITGLK